MSKLHELVPNITAQWDVMSGAPCVKGRRIPVDSIVGNFFAGTRMTEIAADYSLPLQFVEDAVRYELDRRMKRKSRVRATKDGLSQERR